MMDDLRRCSWALGDPLMLRYHDEEWGTPEHDDRPLFEFLALEGFQARLSWLTILPKRENFRRAFDKVDIARVAGYSPADRQRLMEDAGIVRNRLKVDATIDNAQRCLEVRKRYGSLGRYLWQFTGHQTLGPPGGVAPETLVSSSPESDAMSKELRTLGFRFVGSTICYAFMQAVGMVNDHTSDCFRARQLSP